MTEREALNMALEFIELVNKDGWILADFEPQMYEAMNAIKEALAQPEPEYLAFMDTPQRTWVGLTDVLDFIEEFTGAERERHPMFSDGYDLALSHVKELVEAKLKEKNT